MRQMESSHFPSRNKMVYIATFFSHFGAIRYKKFCEKNGWPTKIMPVPRNLSSSCGTCVHYEYESVPTYVQSGDALQETMMTSNMKDEVEQIVTVTEMGYQPLYRAEDC